MEPVASGASTGDLGMAVARERPPESMTLSCCGCPVRPGGVGRCIRDCPGLSGASRGRCPPDPRVSGFQCPRGARPAPARGTLTVRAATAPSRPLGRGHAPPRSTDVETEFPAHSVAQPGLAPWLAAGGRRPGPSRRPCRVPRGRACTHRGLPSFLEQSFPPQRPLHGGRCRRAAQRTDARAGGAAGTAPVRHLEGLRSGSLPRTGAHGSPTAESTMLPQAAGQGQGGQGPEAAEHEGRWPWAHPKLRTVASLTFLSAAKP